MKLYYYIPKEKLPLYNELKKDQPRQFTPFIIDEFITRDGGVVFSVGRVYDDYTIKDYVLCDQPTDLGNTGQKFENFEREIITRLEE